MQLVNLFYNVMGNIQLVLIITFTITYNVNSNQIHTINDENDLNSLNNTISYVFAHQTKKYHYVIIEQLISKEKINLQNKLAFEIWDGGGSKSEMTKWILYCQRTNIVVFMISLFQVSMLKYTLQLWESIINTNYKI